MAYCVVQIDLENGQRYEYPWLFATADEATNKIYELSKVDTKVTYIIKMVPAAKAPAATW